jgi:hypothetical protein
MSQLAAIAAALAPAEQKYLSQARQMQALSFAVHIPLVCFGIAFPAMMLFVESRYLRTGDELYRTLARRWSRILAALFAAGVVTGTILSFELGLLWPNFTGTFGSVFGLGFAIEGFSFFMEAIFIGIYIYGWNRLSPRAHFASGIPIAIAGFTGSLTVISVNGWMNHPTHFRYSDGRVFDVNPWDALFGNSYFWHELTHMYLAGYMVTGFVLASAYGFGGFEAAGAGTSAPRLRSRSRSRHSPRLHRSSSATGTVARSRPTSRPSSPPSRGWAKPPRARPCTSWAGTQTVTSNTGSRFRICSPCSPSTALTPPCRGLMPSRPQTARR